MRLLLLSALYFLIPFNGSAQTWEVGGFIGGSGYMGDINPVKPYKVSDLAFGGQVKRNLDGYWALKLNVMHGTIAADDLKSSNAYQRQRSINFHTPITELSFQAEFNFFNYFPGSLPGNGTRRVTPYLFTGVGGVLFNPKTYYGPTDDKDEYILHDYVTEGEELSDRYKRHAISIPYGAGLKYNISGNWNLISEIGYRTAFTDYLDDVSGVYPAHIDIPGYHGLSGVLSDPSPAPGIGRAGVQRGDFRKRDTYMFMGISLTYTFVPIKCPTF
jgi:opacity protein-like surface antigen